MQLTTIARVKTWSPLSPNSTQHDGLLRSLIGATSARLEDHLRRHVLIEQRTEDFSVEPMARKFFLRAAPVYSTASNNDNRQPSITATAPALTYSPGREFTEDAEDPLTYYFRLRDGIVEFDFPFNYLDVREPGAFRAVYTGGMAYTLDQLDATSLTQAGTALAIGDAVTGSLSGATGEVLAYSSGATISVKVLSGEFRVGERFQLTSDSTRYATFTGWTATGKPLCMSHPEIVEACNMQVSRMFQRRENLGMTSISFEGATISMEKGGLLNDVKDILDPLVRYGASY